MNTKIKRILSLFKKFNLLAKLTKSNNPIYELPNATKQPQTEANDNVNITNTNQLIGDTVIRLR